MQMSMRRFTRLTNAFSKKLENLEHAVALYYMHYNFCRIHRSLRVTPAMERAFPSMFGALRKSLRSSIDLDSPCDSRLNKPRKQARSRPRPE